MNAVFNEAAAKNKKAKLDYLTITADPDLKNMESLTREALMKKLDDCLSLIHHQNDAAISLDAEVKKLKAEIVTMKLTFANVDKLPALKEELMYRNHALKGKAHPLKSVYTKPNTKVGLVKMLLTCKETRDDVIFRGKVYVHESVHFTAEIDFNREMRRCFKCQKYGHMQRECRAASHVCGKGR